MKGRSSNSRGPETVRRGRKCCLILHKFAWDWIKIDVCGRGRKIQGIIIEKLACSVYFLVTSTKVLIWGFVIPRNRHKGNRCRRITCRLMLRMRSDSNAIVSCKHRRLKGSH
eukprot:Gregarina_sp_Pseudo_9__5399@NODE_660_length_2410_cov_8_181358_g623_i0_p4_GENE_NODE_660_length_2410_cov_8_181358_g623_i0NODE_660_length_2410_cov_8_181358_g623_i0_p4_ORF_typecomplete_len112_score13_40Neurensin/PF14927_6/0_15_NODE_660_length_2410_cov_8_181358_g623_i016732008